MSCQRFGIEYIFLASSLERAHFPYDSVPNEEESAYVLHDASPFTIERCGTHYEIRVEYSLFTYLSIHLATESALRDAVCRVPLCDWDDGDEQDRIQVSREYVGRI